VTAAAFNHFQGFVGHGLGQGDNVQAAATSTDASCPSNLEQGAGIAAIENGQHAIASSYLAQIQGRNLEAWAMPTS